MIALKQIQSELDSQKTMILETSRNVTEKVTQNINNIILEKFNTLESKQKELEERVETQDKRLYFLEKQARQRNILFFGIEEGQTSYANLEKDIITFISKHFSMKLNQRDIEVVKRLGKKGEKRRPILVTFTTLGLKINLFKQRNLLNNTEYYIMEDYPKSVLNTRRELKEQLNAEREKGNKAVIRYDKLIIYDNQKTSHSNTNTNKRPLSISPENKQQQRQINKETSMNKKTKVHIPQTSIENSSSCYSGGTQKQSTITNFLVNKNSSTLNSKQYDANNQQ